MKPFTVPGLLRAAASYIEVHGHEQRKSKSGGAGLREGPCCPIVAVKRLVGYSPLRGPAFDALGSALEDRHAPHGFISSWSDETPTAEVLATMRQVARNLDV